MRHNDAERERFIFKKVGLKHRFVGFIKWQIKHSTYTCLLLELINLVAFDFFCEEEEIQVALWRRLFGQDFTSKMIKKRKNRCRLTGSRGNEQEKVRFT